MSGFDPDGPLPEIPESNASKSSRDRVVETARAKNLTIRQLAARAGSYSGLAFVGTPATIADEMEAWLDERASDRFNMMFPWLPGGIDDFTGRVVPELQRRGLFRTAYQGRTLRDHLGLPRPETASSPPGPRRRRPNDVPDTASTSNEVKSYVQSCSYRRLRKRRRAHSRGIVRSWPRGHGDCPPSGEDRGAAPCRCRRGGCPGPGRAGRYPAGT